MTQLSIRRKGDGKVWKIPEELNLLWDEERDEEPVSRDLFYIGLILDKYGLGIQGKVYDGGSYCFYLIPEWFEIVLPSQEENERLRAEIEGLRELHEREMSSIHEAYVEAKEAYESEHSQNFLRSRGII